MIGHRLYEHFRSPVISFMPVHRMNKKTDVIQGHVCSPLFHEQTRKKKEEKRKKKKKGSGGEEGRRKKVKVGKP